jgi:hypothetical protein
VVKSAPRCNEALQTDSLVTVLHRTPLKVPSTSVGQDTKEEDGVKEGNRSIETGSQTPSQRLNPVSSVVLSKAADQPMSDTLTHALSILTGFLAQAHHPLVNNLFLSKRNQLLESCVPNEDDSPMLGLDESRIDTDRTGKVREGSSRDVYSLSLHFEAIRTLRFSTRYACRVNLFRNSRRLLAHRSIEPDNPRQLPLFLLCLEAGYSHVISTQECDEECKVDDGRELISRWRVP